MEEEDALPEGAHNSFTYKGITYPAKMLCDLLHTESAQSLCTYEQDFYAGMPVLTRNAFGEGAAYYVTTSSDAAFYRTIVKEICTESGIRPLIDTPDCIEVTARTNGNGTFLFFLNHDTQEQGVTLNCTGKDILKDTLYKEGDTLYLPAKDVAIIQTA